MYRAVGPPVLELLQRLAKELQALAVDEFDLAIGRKGYDQPWNAVDDQTRLTLAFAERLFGALQIVDVGEQNIPADDTSARTTKREPADLKPPVDAIETSNALDNLVGIA